ncbi:iron-sulfur cluster biosynthesis transcriptional regulator SufR [Gloeothece verrucosa]|uniref:Putative transcriptional regulator n=1 Tax=Gloeothece verrucosa (strain PCC 7822) TaxID=497965 RepID=E0UAX0_GLOV7|nr:iron-sulfur cluster biosynthesis transcriptional regulator SufR [Gloeothece verrucosa]ADN15092.1 putative transcriptional regulator [Gloeothece verrucosa PCC 7822]
MTTTQPTSTKQDILNYLLKYGQATAQTLAGTLDISPQAIRRHLKDLETDELIEHKAVQSGMGRPQYVYCLSRQGREKYPHRYGEFAVSFLDTLIETVGEKQVGEVLRKQWQRKAAEYRDRLGIGSIKERVNKLVQLRQEEGYMAELLLIENHQGRQPGYILAEHNCAISEVAESYPSVCGHELEMFSAVLPDCIIERTHWINNGEHRCGYLIQPR